jgi:hypothetical protein
MSLSEPEVPQPVSSKSAAFETVGEDTVSSGGFEEAALEQVCFFPEKAFSCYLDK